VTLYIACTLQGLPTILGPLLPLVLYGCCLPARAGRKLAGWAAVILALYSLPAHKEFRWGPTRGVVYAGPCTQGGRREGDGLSCLQGS
jgi:hypothetical protein